MVGVWLRSAKEGRALEEGERGGRGGRGRKGGREGGGGGRKEIDMLMAG